jgi:branched-subunit amino acid ABC-type transport system permease component
MIERFPNFAHIDLTLIGTIVTFSMVKLLGINPYYSWPVSMIICGLIGVIIHVGMVEPIRRRRDDRIALTIAFMALGLVLQSLVGVYSYWIVTSRHETTRGFI